MTHEVAYVLKYLRKFVAVWTAHEIVQPTVALIPWRSNLAILDKLKDYDSRLWYAPQTLENGWSRYILVMQIDSRLHKRIGQTANNFDIALSPENSEMANQILKLYFKRLKH